MQFFFGEGGENKFGEFNYLAYLCINKNKEHYGNIQSNYGGKAERWLNPHNRTNRNMQYTQASH